MSRRSRNCLRKTGGFTFQGKVGAVLGRTCSEIAGGHMSSAGIHHVTAICSDPRRNVGVLYRRSRAAPGQADRQFRRSHHLASLLRGRDRQPRDGPDVLRLGQGCPRAATASGRRSATAFIIPERSLAYWTGRLAERASRTTPGAALRPDLRRVARSGRDEPGTGRHQGRARPAGLVRRAGAGGACDPRILRRDPHGQRGGADRAAC